MALYNYLSNDAIDGNFRWSTDDAVRQFQHDNGLYEDGIIGFYTWNALANLD
ncbi:MAG: peptidoglycan-binding protein [Chroococcidiopsidaceae cyanobacterium CP_BM_ER_R8_30]|nr:peptidoglycan-binding protein [Chroococcidiopsidaceae cyanobacterium CP_BM_ER_R8_30]